jgi:hypothetical protein
LHRVAVYTSKIFSAAGIKRPAAVIMMTAGEILACHTAKKGLLDLVPSFGTAAFGF